MSSNASGYKQSDPALSLPGFEYDDLPDYDYELSHIIDDQHLQIFDPEAFSQDSTLAHQALNPSGSPPKDVNGFTTDQRTTYVAPTEPEDDNPHDIDDAEDTPTHTNKPADLPTQTRPPKLRKWKPAEISQLDNLRRSGLSWDDISSQIGRSPLACEKYYSRFLRDEDDGRQGNGAQWAEDEDNMLMEMRGRGMGFKDIAAQMPGRTYGACAGRHLAIKNKRAEKALLQHFATE